MINIHTIPSIIATIRHLDAVVVGFLPNFSKSRLDIVVRNTQSSKIGAAKSSPELRGVGGVVDGLEERPRLLRGDMYISLLGSI